MLTVKPNEGRSPNKVTKRKTIIDYHQVKRPERLRTTETEETPIQKKARTESELEREKKQS